MGRCLPKPWLLFPTDLFWLARIARVITYALCDTAVGALGAKVAAWAVFGIP
jgi:hypothetical protein